MERVRPIVEGRHERNVERLKALLSIPSISADPAYAAQVAACAEHVRELLEDMGIRGERVDTEGHPIVLGRYTHPENRRTLLVYGHYDVQPVDPLDLWTHPPFEPHVEGGRIFARGAADDKGQFLAHLAAAEAWLEAEGRIPVNLVFLIEGEEETASNHLHRFVAGARDRLVADGVVVSDTGLFGEAGLPAVTYGLRGIAAAEIEVTGPARDLHSGGFGGSVANPATELCRIVAGFHDAEGRVRIPGFYDAVRPLEAWEREAFAALPFDEAADLAATGAPAPFGEAGYTTLERRWARPTCEVNGLYGGYAGEGGKTIVPRRAGCKVTCRLVPDQEPDEILEALERHVRAAASPAVRVRFTRGGGARPVVLDRNSFLVAAARPALRAGFGRDPVFIREGGSIPVVNTFKEVLGLDTLLVGFARPGCNAHAPDEWFDLDDFRRAAVTAAVLYRTAAEG